MRTRHGHPNRSEAPFRNDGFHTHAEAVRFEEWNGCSYEQLIDEEWMEIRAMMAQDDMVDDDFVDDHIAVNGQVQVKKNDIPDIVFDDDDYGDPSDLGWWHETLEGRAELYEKSVLDRDRSN